MDISSLYEDGINTKEYSLSIRLAPNGFSFCIYNILSDNSFRFSNTDFENSAHYITALEEAVTNNEILLEQFKSIDIIIASGRFSFVPAELYNEDDYAEIYNFNHPVQDEEILIDNLKQTNIVNVYGIDKSVFSFIMRTFPDAKIHHNLSVLIEYFQPKSKLGNSAKMYCQLYNNTIDIVCFKKGKLIIANRFKVNHINDAAYMVLNVWKNIDFSQENDILQLAGNKETISTLSEILKTYIATITPVVFPAQIFNLGQESLDAPFDLIVLPICEL